MIDAGNDRNWPQTLMNQLNAFRQGSLVELPPFAYHALPQFAIWQATKLATDDGSPAVLVEIDPADWPPFGIVTSQSCDIDEEGRNTKPWVRIAPVYQLDASDRRLGAVKQWKVNYLAPITTKGSTWVADLRIEVPVEKSWLVSKVPQAAFLNDDEFRLFGRFCGYNRARPGLATQIYTGVLQPLESHLRQLQSEKPDVYSDLMEQLEHLFLEVFDDPLNPFWVKLIFVSRSPLREEVTADLDAWSGRESERQRLDFVVMPSNYRQLDSLSYVEARGWYKQDLARFSGSS